MISIDLLRLLNEVGIEYTTQTNKGWINIQCPFCSDSGQHGGLNRAGGYYHCFRCGGHKLEKIIRRLTGYSDEEVEALIFKYSGRGSVVEKINRQHAETVKLPGGVLGRNHRKYLIGRRFNPDELVDKYKIRGTGITGEWAFRIIIPIYFDNRLVSFQGRDVTGKQDLRYKTLDVELSVMDPKSILYNVDNCKTERLILVEGVFDCWRMGDGCAATLGTSMTEKQLRIISTRFRRVSFLFDAEKEAQQRAAAQALRLAALGLQVDMLDTELEHDPGDFTEEETNQVRKELGLV